MKGATEGGEEAIMTRRVEIRHKGGKREGRGERELHPESYHVGILVLCVLVAGPFALKEFELG